MRLKEEGWTFDYERRTYAGVEIEPAGEIDGNGLALYFIKSGPMTGQKRWFRRDELEPPERRKEQE